MANNKYLPNEQYTFPQMYAYEKYTDETGKERKRQVPCDFSLQHLTSTYIFAFIKANIDNEIVIEFYNNNRNLLTDKETALTSFKKIKKSFKETFCVMQGSNKSSKLTRDELAAEIDNLIKNK